MREVMYDLNSVMIAIVLLISMACAIELGYRVGFRFQGNVNESSRGQVNAIQGSLMGILALLLGFTFSLSLQRYDSRSQAVVSEANSIGTTFLRSQLLVPPQAEAASNLLRQYVDIRVRASTVTLDNRIEHQTLINEAKAIQNLLWIQAQLTLQQDDRMASTGLYIQSLNEMIDSLSTRDAALRRHVPELVLFLLFGTFLMTGSIVGYSSGIAGRRSSYITFVMVTLIVLLVFVIIDLDRPRRGLIEVNQSSMLELQAEVQNSR